MTSIPSGYRIPSHGHRSAITWHCRVEGRLEPDSPQMKIEIDPDRANLVGITNADVATSTSAAISGNPVGIYKEGIRTSRLLSAPAAGSRAAFTDRKSLRQLIARECQSPIAFGGDVERHPRDGADSASRTLPNLIYLVLSDAWCPRVGGARTNRTETDRSQESLPPGYQLQIGGKRQSKLMDSRISLSFF